MITIDRISDLPSAMPSGWTARAYRVYDPAVTFPNMPPMRDIETGEVINRKRGEELRKTGFTTLKIIWMQPRYRVEVLLYKPKGNQ